MSSILTNVGATRALQVMRETDRSMNKVQAEIATGKRVNNAADNASNFSIATKMESDRTGLGAVKDAIGQSKAMVSTFTTALDNTVESLDKLKANLITAMNPGADKTAIYTEMKATVEGMKTAAESATFNGQNWLVLGADAPTSHDMVVSYDGAAKTVGKLSVTAADVALYNDAGDGLLDALSAADLDITADGADLDAMLTKVETALTAVTKAASTLGAKQNHLDTQEEFVTTLSESLKTGVGSIVDADMEEASARLNALQVQQQLATQALSIANQAPQNILSLFR